MECNRLEDLARIIDISSVKSICTLADIDTMVFSCMQYPFICAFALPSMTSYLIEKLRNNTNTNVGGTVGFPSGCDTTEAKVFIARQLVRMGCDELDMVINIGQLKSKNYELVYHDIKAVIDAAENRPVKTILEVTNLTDEQIVQASKIAEDAGATYIKTGTGWCSEPTTLHHIKLIRSVVKPTTKIKAAGGIRDLHTLLAMQKAGCDRFGLGTGSALSIMDEAKTYFF